MSKALQHLLNQNYFIPFGKEYKGQEYDSTIILNKGKVAKALANSKSIYPFVPEFYDDNCPLEKVPVPIIDESEFLGKGSFGSVHLITIHDEKLRGAIKIPVVLKTIVITKPIRRHVNGKKSEYTTDPFSNEIINSTLASNLFSEGICPHFPIFLGFFLCESNLDEVIEKGGYAKDIIVDRTSHPLTGYILIEALDSNLEFSQETQNKGYRKLVKQGMKNSTKTLKNIAFQIIFAIIKMQEQYGMMHNDLHEGNVGIILTRKKPYTWKGIRLDTDLPLGYRIGKKNFNLPNRYVIAKISDFGIAGTFGRPKVLLKTTRDKTEEGEFNLYNQRFRKGFDLAYFIISFTQITCYEAYDIEQDPKRKHKIFNLAKVMSQDLLELYYDSQGSKRSRTALKLAKRFQKITSFQQLHIIMISDGLFKHVPPFIPSKTIAKAVEPLNYLLTSETFREYRETKVDDFIKMSRHSGKSAKEIWQK